MGHPDNITTGTFKSLGKKVGKKEPEVRQWVFDYLEAQYNDSEASKDSQIEEMFVKASKAWGQSIEQAKKQTFNMLKSEM